MTALAAVAEQFAAGEPVLVGDAGADPVLLTSAAAAIDSDQLATLHELGRGNVLLAVGGDVASRLRLSSTRRGPRQSGLSPMATIDAATGISTGWSLEDRARAMRVAAAPASGPSDVVSPGHVLTACVDEHGSDGAAAALELAVMASQPAAVALCAVLDSRGAVRPLAQLRSDPRFARLPHASSGELLARAVGRRALGESVACALPTRHGFFRAVGFGHDHGEATTIALVHGDPAAVPAPLVHVHIACRFGEVFGSLLCDCRAQLDSAVEQIVAEGAGAIIYAHPAEPGLKICSADEKVDVTVAIGLLRAVGVSAMRPTLRASGFARDFQASGLGIHELELAA